MENKWINVNLYCYYLSEEEVAEILKEKYNISCPNLPISLENLAMSEIKINNQSLIDFAVKNKLTYFYHTNDNNTFTINEGYIPNFKQIYFYKDSSESKKKKFEKFVENYKKYKKFVKDKPEYKKYLKDVKSYEKLFEKVESEMYFFNSKYNERGYLLNCENKQTGKVFSILIGDCSWFGDSDNEGLENVIVLRVKK